MCFISGDRLLCCSTGPKKCLLEKECSRFAGWAFKVKCFHNSSEVYLKEEAHTTINKREGRIGQYEQILPSSFQRMQHLYHFCLHPNKYDSW
jgi:hypothetical protein